mgnify:CR=1 FL=1
MKEPGYQASFQGGPLDSQVRVVIIATWVSHRIHRNQVACHVWNNAENLYDYSHLEERTILEPES